MKPLSLFIFLFVSGASAFALTTGAQARRSKFFYFELVPKETLVLSFKAPRHCKDESEKLIVQDFFSEKSYPSVDAGKEVPVRILNLHADYFSICSAHAFGSITKQYTLPADADKMSHVYVTTPDGVEVRTESQQSH